MKQLRREKQLGMQQSTGMPKPPLEMRRLTAPLS
jgi:hypothetical protein